MASMTTQDQFHVMMNHLAGLGAAQQQPQQSSADRAQRSKLHARDQQTEDFDGTTTAWGNWAFGFNVVARKQSPKAFDMLQETEGSTGEAMGELIAEGADENRVRARFVRFAACLLLLVR